MLETPLYGRFRGENKRLVFSAHSNYHVLIGAAIIGGAGGALVGLASPFLPVPVPVTPEWWLFFGTATALAGLWASLSLQFLAFNIREGSYRRRQGPGLFPRTTGGSIKNLEALVLHSENRAILGVTYRLVFYWKNRLEPPMVVRQDTRAIPPGAPLNYGAAPLLAEGARYAHALGIPFFDNSHFSTPNPVPVIG